MLDLLFPALYDSRPKNNVIFLLTDLFDATQKFLFFFPQGMALSNTNVNVESEAVARMTTFYQSMTPREKEMFLSQNNLVRREDALSVSNNAMNGNEVNTLVLSPARVGGGTVRTRAHEALRLVDDDNTISQRVQGKPLMNVSGVRFTDAEIRDWFDTMDLNKNGYLSKEEFRAMYGQLDTFGVPPSKKQIDEQLKKMNAFGDDKLSFEEFAVLVSQLARR